MEKDKLNIFNELKELDTKNYNFYNELSDEEKKKIGLFPIIRWASAVTKNNMSEAQEYYIQAMDDISQVFFSLSKHVDLQWKLMASKGVGVSLRREWIPNLKKITTNKLDRLLLEYMPYLNRDELNIVKDKITVEQIKEICLKYGMEDGEQKDYINEVKKLQKDKM